jgi:hypothetical protein
MIYQSLDGTASPASDLVTFDGKAGTYRTNEGVSLASISNALAAEKRLKFCF